jgi:hypothetical protein
MIIIIVRDEGKKTHILMKNKFFYLVMPLDVPHIGYVVIEADEKVIIVFLEKETSH